MLRRRIFSSAMASVMALSAVAVVAQAEETQVKSYDELDKLINTTYGADYRADVLSTYGETSAAWMLDALEAADAILYNSKSTEADYTVAYKMVTAVEKKLVIYTAEDLEKLIKKCQAYTADGNYYNEELGDIIYEAETYGLFEDAIANAETFVTSEESALITDAYVKLEEALKKLLENELPTVTKAQFRAVLKEYEAILEDEHAYDEWRLGTYNVWAVAGLKDAWQIDKTISFGGIYNFAMSAANEIEDAYNTFDEIKSANKTTNSEIYSGYSLAQKVVALYNTWTPDSSTRATKSGVAQLLSQYNGQLVYTFANTDAANLKSAIDDAVTSYNAPLAAEDKVDMPTYYSATNSNDTPAADGLWNLTYTYEKDWQGNITGDENLVAATAFVRPAITVYVPVDEDGHWTGEDVQTAKPVKGTDANAGKWTIDGSSINVTTEDVYKYQPITKNTKADLAKMIKVTAADVKAVNPGAHDSLPNLWDNKTDINSGAWDAVLGAEFYENMADDTVVNLTTAYGLAEAYMNKLYTKTDDNGTEYTTYEGYMAVTAGENDNLLAYIDDVGVVSAGTDVNAEATGSSKEWQTVYRYLKYALEGHFGGTADAGCAHKMKDVEALIDDCYELADLTGDAAIFNPSHMAMVVERTEAKEWVTAAKSDKMYKENTAGTDADGDPYDASDAVYHELLNVYNKLDAEYKALDLSFQQVYDRIAEVSAMIDDGDVNATTDLLDALDRTAAALSMVDDVTYYNTNNWQGVTEDYTDNAAFDDERIFQGINRVVAWNIEKNEGYTTNISAMQEATGLTGDSVLMSASNGSHKELYLAYAALNEAVKKAQEPEVVVIAGDYNGDGKVSLGDCAAILTDVTAGTLDQTKSGDYNGDGKISLADCAAILTDITNGKL